MSNETTQEKWVWEYTDTFGGELNYSWVRRGSVYLDPGATLRTAVVAAKADAGLTGVRMHRRYSFDEVVRLDEVGAARALFLRFDGEVRRV